MESEVFSRRNLVGNKGLENSTGVIRSELNYAEKLKIKSARRGYLFSQIYKHVNCQCSSQELFMFYY